MDLTNMPVYRTRSLPAGELRGRFLLAEGVIERTRDALLAFAMAGIRDRGHEGLVFWAGLECGPLTALTTVVVPNADHSEQGVFVTEAAYGRVAKEARSAGVALLAQVHSHPGADARHSDGDDDLIVMPFEGMLAVVVPNFGIGWQGVADAKVHQFQSRRWTLCTDASVKGGVTTARLQIDAR